MEIHGLILSVWETDTLPAEPALEDAPALPTVALAPPETPLKEIPALILFAPGGNANETVLVSYR